MTAQEKLSLAKLSQQFADFIEEDKKWKEEVTSKLDPLVQEQVEKQILSKYSKTAWRVVVGIVALLASMGAAWKYLFAPLFPHVLGATK